jgi:predicted secreted acid phosphatase
MSKKKIVIVDIDGTIATPGERLKHLQVEPKNWDAFYEDCFDDAPILDTIELVRLLDKKYQLVFCTGRRESCRQKTLNWFDKHGVPHTNELLLMRADGDKRHDTITKPEMVKRLLGPSKLNRIAFVLEDRNSMVAKWRELGVTCFQVAEGDF